MGGRLKWTFLSTLRHFFGTKSFGYQRNYCLQSFMLFDHMLCDGKLRVLVAFRFCTGSIQTFRAAFISPLSKQDFSRCSLSCLLNFPSPTHSQGTLLTFVDDWLTHFAQFALGFTHKKYVVFIFISWGCLYMYQILCWNKCQICFYWGFLCFNARNYRVSWEKEAQNCLWQRSCTEISFRGTVSCLLP